MKKVLIIVSILFLLSLSGCFSRYSSSTDPSKYLAFKLLDDGTYTVTGFKKLPVKDIVIPSTYNDRLVTEVADGAFNRGSNSLYPDFAPIKSVVISEGVKIIGDGAFQYSGSSSYVLPNSLEIVGDYAFFENNYDYWKNINFPENLKKIGAYSFKCSIFPEDLYLEDIELGIGAFVYSQVKKVTFSDYHTTIPAELFRGVSSLEEVVIPNTCIEVGSSAFYGCNIKNINFSENLTKFGAYAFYENKIEELKFNASELIFGENSFGNIRTLKNITFNNTEKIENLSVAFSNSSLDDIYFNNVENYVLLDGGVCEEKLEGYELLLAPSNFNSFEQISVIRSYSISGREFEEIYIANNTVIEPRAFLNIVIKGELYIGSDAVVKSKAFFEVKMKSLKLHAQEVEESAFIYATIDEAEISTKTIKKETLYYPKGIKCINFLEGVEEIQEGAICKAEDLENIYLPASLKKVEKEGFYFCENLVNIYYGLEEGTPAEMNVSSFAAIVSNPKDKNEKSERYLNSELKIYVYKNVYSKCYVKWYLRPTSDYVVYMDVLSKYIVIIENAN